MKRPTHDFREAVREVVARALAEDVGAGDVTSEAILPADAAGAASIVQKEPGVLFGFDAAREAFMQAGAEGFEPGVGEGQWRDARYDPVARASGPLRALLAGERVALNLLGHLSGVATLTARFVQAVEGTGAQILDTRKTTPGLRALEKAAVGAGGGANHRMGLDDAILVKDNHIFASGSLSEAVRRAREGGDGREVEVECAGIEDVREALEAGADRLLLDNMDPDKLREAVALVQGEKGGPSLEASGGITLDNVAEVAATGVDFISVGALTHSAPAIDLSMELIEATVGTESHIRSEGPE